MRLRNCRLSRTASGQLVLSSRKHISPAIVPSPDCRYRAPIVFRPGCPFGERCGCLAQRANVGGPVPIVLVVQVCVVSSPSTCYARYPAVPDFVWDLPGPLLYRKHCIDTPRTVYLRWDVAEDTTHYEALLAEHGAGFPGVQSGPGETLILFVDPNFRTILAVTESEFSSQTISRRLEETRRAYEFDSTVQKSLC